MVVAVLEMEATTFHTLVIVGQAVEVAIQVEVVEETAEIAMDNLAAVGAAIILELL